MNASTSQFTRYLVLITAAVLAFFSVASLTRIGVNPDAAGWVAIYAFIMLIESSILVFCYFRLLRRSKSVFWMAIVILGLNIILPVFDQVGPADVLFILLNAATLWRLYAARSEFLPA